MNIIPIHPERFERREDEGQASSCDLGSKGVLTAFICQNSFNVHFQPIISTAAEDVYAYEGLCRVVGNNPFGSIDKLFAQARKCGEICALDMLCRQNTIRAAAQNKIAKTGAQLFINVYPTSLQQGGHSAGETERMVKDWGLQKENVVLEITEQEAVSNYSLFVEAIQYYRDCGFKIAIDDFGAGYGGLKMLSLIGPDYVKIDRHFFNDLNSAHINYSLIDSIATICHRIGIDVIAEGVETENEIKICQDFDIQLIQGYFCAKPAAKLLTKNEIRFP